MSRLKGAARSVWEPVANRAARSYMIGATVADARGAAEALAALGISSATCYWNAPDDTPRVVADVTLDAIGAFASVATDEKLVALKAPALRFNEDLVDELAGQAVASRVSLLFDSHRMEEAERTIALALSASARGASTGVALPGRWGRSERDALRASSQGLRVRVVKGEWEADAGGRLAPEAGFLRVVDALAGTPTTVAVATHDARLAEEALLKLRAQGTPCELELLVGLPISRPVALARDLGVPIRLYLPFGHVWPIGLWQVREDPRTAWWVAERGLVRRGTYAKPVTSSARQDLSRSRGRRRA